MIDPYIRRKVPLRRSMREHRHKKDARKEPLPEAFKTCADGREICYTIGWVRQSLAGRNEYRRRINAMLERQKGFCCLHGYAPDCPGFLAEEDATFEHENGRSGGRRDDRIEVSGKWINGAAHLICNHWKGSRRINYNETNRREDSQ
jgi:hypothetical protein